MFGSRMFNFWPRKKNIAIVRKPDVQNLDTSVWIYDTKLRNLWDLTTSPNRLYYKDLFMNYKKVLGFSKVSDSWMLLECLNIEQVHFLDRYCSSLLDMIKQAAVVNVSNDIADSTFVDALVGPMSCLIVIFAIVISNVGDVVYTNVNSIKNKC